MNNNKKLATNIMLMFLVYFLPKIMSFFLVPVYTNCLTTEEYGISDLILGTASLIAPFISLATPNAILRFTIENKTDRRPYQVGIRIYVRGMIILLVLMGLVSLFLRINPIYIACTYMVVGFSVLADIYLSYARGLETMKIVTFCGVASAFVSIICNILFIVVFKWGIYGFIFASMAGYIFDIVVLAIYNRKKCLLKGITRVERAFTNDMLHFSVPLIFSGISWWVVSSSDRYFVSWMCGSAANGVYAVAYKIPVILQSLDNVFGQAWLYTLYDSYKTDDGRNYIAKVFDAYNFLFCLGCSFLIIIDLFLSKLLFANEFFTAWKYVPFLLLSVVFNSASGLMGNFLSIYKKTRIAMNISILAAGINLILNYLLIFLLKDAMGAAIATAITFMVSCYCTIKVSVKVSGVSINVRKQMLVYLILLTQSITIVMTQNIYITSVGFLLIILINWRTIMWAKNKWKNLIRIKK